MKKWYSVIKAGRSPYEMENWTRLLLTAKGAKAMREKGYVVIAI